MKKYDDLAKDLENIFPATGKPYKPPVRLFKKFDAAKREELINTMIEFLSWHNIYRYKYFQVLHTLSLVTTKYALSNKKLNKWWKEMTKEISLFFFSDSSLQAFTHRTFMMVKAVDDKKSSYLHKLSTQRDLNKQNYDLMKQEILNNNTTNQSSPLAIIPPQIVCIIASHLDLSNLFNFGLACKFLLELTRKNEVWKGICEAKIQKNDNPALSKEIKNTIKNHTNGYSTGPLSFWRIYRISYIELQIAKDKKSEPTSKYDPN